MKTAIATPLFAMKPLKDPQEIKCVCKENDWKKSICCAPMHDRKPERNIAESDFVDSQGEQIKDGDFLEYRNPSWTEDRTSVSHKARIEDGVCSIHKEGEKYHRVLASTWSASRFTIKK